VDIRLNHSQSISSFPSLLPSFPPPHLSPAVLIGNAAHHDASHSLCQIIESQNQTWEEREVKAIVQNCGECEHSL